MTDFSEATKEFKSWLSTYPELRAQLANKCKEQPTEIDCSNYSLWPCLCPLAKRMLCNNSKRAVVVKMALHDTLWEQEDL